MNILALDTSTEYCSVALWLDGRIEARGVHAGQRHTELLLGMIDDVMTAHALRVRDLTGLAFGKGPGSFTGLRIGCGVVQGMALGAGLPVVGIGTLLALAAGSGCERVVCCVDARMQEIYHAAYALRDGEWQAVHEPSTCAPEAAPLLPGHGWLGCGSGFEVYRAALETRYAGRLDRVEPSRFPHAREVALLAVPSFERGETLEAHEAAPVYLRDKVALRIDERAKA